jgi:hypothetical protein
VFAGYAHDAPFDHPFYDIGSADNLRGLERESFSGDVLVFANLEYIKGFAKYRTLRISLFIDWAYDTETGESKAYGAPRSTFN